VRAGVAVHAFNHRTVAGILDMIRTLAALVGAPTDGETLAVELAARLARIGEAASRLPRRPRVYFEEWDEPIITAIRWVSELIETAGGTDVFAGLSHHKSAKDRIVSAGAVIAAEPDIVIASWCGKKFRQEKFVARAGYCEIPAVRDGQVYEIKSPLILQPGPAALTDGVDAIARIIRNWAETGSRA
jgi:iron complex transport system substrate-binding protein